MLVSKGKRPDGRAMNSLRAVRSMSEMLSSLAGAILMLLVRAYQVGLSPLLLGACKFCPSCSDYFIEAVRRHGPIRGLWLGLWRICRCHPFCAGGYDPVPQ